MKIRNERFNLIFSDDLSDKWLNNEIECKGYYCDVIIYILNERRSFHLNFYDIVRLKQDVESNTSMLFCFFEPNLIIIPKVNLDNMIKASENIVLNKLYLNMTEDKSNKDNDDKSYE